MGSRVNVCSVNYLENPTCFTSEFKLEITFEVFEHLPGDLEWQLVYVGSGESSEFDQELDSVLVGPTPEGKHKFVFTAKAPDATKIPQEDVVGVSVLLLKLKYNEKEFLNLGWFVSNEYTDEELKENPPAKPDVEKLMRTVKTDDIRVTSFPIRWNEGEEEEMPPAQAEEPVDEADLLPLEDTEQDQEEEDELAEEEKEEEGDVDLEESMDKDEGTEEEVDTEEDIDGEATSGSGEASSEDVEMNDDDAMENDESETSGVGDSKMDSAVDAPSAGDAPLGDKTNDTSA